MFYKVFFYIFFAIAVLITFLLCFTKPVLHNTVFVYDSAYEVVEKETKTPETKKVSALTNVVKSPAVETKVENIPTTKTVQVQKPVSTTQKIVNTAPVQNKKVAVSNTKVQKTPVQKTVNAAQTPIQKTVTTPSTPKVVQHTVPKTVTKQPVQQTITPAQEEILWNKWRSNIQNQIMSDVRLPILPQGTVFRFSFDVDKYGRVTNVQTWSETPTFTPLAIQNIAPVIRSYQGRQILNFPTGSNRITTTVTGHWRISTKTKYSNASNFNDVETVQKGY